jgi:toxin ParE1/3/4
MPFEVRLTAGAEQDLAGIHAHIARTEGRGRADRVLDRLLTLGERLAEFPERGSHPRELLALGIREYRQVIMKPYRMIYEVTGERVIIYLIADARRDMQTLLAQRLLRG